MPNKARLQKNAMVCSGESKVCAQQGPLPHYRRVTRWKTPSKTMAPAIAPMKPADCPG
jgi:hypothetical protein